MPKYANLDHYLDADAGVLKNKLGIRDEALLATAEADYVAARSYELAQNPIAGRFDLAHLQAIHRHLFGDVYDWAGALRDVDISKGQSYFAHYRYIESSAAPLFEQLAKENYLAGLDEEAFSERAAYFLGEWNALHPFRDGNGRALREFLGLLAKRNEYFILWTDITQEVMTQAAIAAFRGDPSLLRGLIRAHLIRL
ncbi:MAG: cell filamentation protein Fic [Deltaproteobacteria bacterium]|nr:cell filamentation protein Fic [Deltaproteobacteria bacterium]